MSIKQVLQEAEKLVTPSDEEESMVKESLKIITDIINSSASKLNLDVDLFEGGSIAKNTWLPGISDMDFFLRFDYSKYKSENLSDLAEQLLKNCFKIKKLHGSRDYFKTHHFGFDVEFVPVLKISEYTKAKNITDVSPLHVYWLKKKQKDNPRLLKEIRLAKQFFKAAGVYGAESYIKGFSGHVIEILMAYYGSFEKLVREAGRWEDGLIIDVQKFYKSKKAVLDAIDADKRLGPLIVVDPVQPERNAAAVVSLDKFRQIRSYCKQFSSSPAIEKFNRKWRTIEELRKSAKRSKLVLIQAEPLDDKVDIAGSQILKKFEQVQRALIENDFKILKSGWQWDKKSDALLWLFIDSKILSKLKRHFGPPIEMVEHVKAFRKSWREAKVSSGKLYVDLRRKFRTVDEIIKELKKDRELEGFRFL